MGKLIFIASLIFSSWAIMPANAQELEKDAPKWNVNELMRSLAEVKKSKATFVERKFISLLKTPLKYSGTLSYTAPGHLEKYTLLPKPESMVLDQNTLVVQSGDAQKRALTLQNY
ncbi:MAG: outer membrane lipoprotein carrier protein LolA, partial [Gallionella sp.]